MNGRSPTPLPVPPSYHGSMNRVEEIRRRLTETFRPISLHVEDQSHLHPGHAGARSGGGHYSITIIAPAFAGKTPVQRHRMVYDAVRELMRNQIHALSIRASASDEI